jgi:hypothetical protein
MFPSAEPVLHHARLDVRKHTPGIAVSHVRIHSCFAYAGGGCPSARDQSLTKPSTLLASWNWPCAGPPTSNQLWNRTAEGKLASIELVHTK